MLVGSREFIEEARTVRKMLGGGIRQAGILASAGIIALEEGPKRLHVDHGNAAYLGQELAQIHGICIDLTKVVSNIVCFGVSSTGINAPDFSRHLAKQGILANALDGDVIRMVTHLDVDRAACERAVKVVKDIAASRKPREVSMSTASDI
jgi:threonine aldolase